jgi:hypothetical protein
LLYCSIKIAVIGDVVSLIHWLAITHCSMTAASLDLLFSLVHADPLWPLVTSSGNSHDQSVLALRASSLWDLHLDTALHRPPRLPAIQPSSQKWLHLACMFLL